MAVDFRCEKCGKLLSVDAPAGTSLKCPHCKAKLVVPAGLASLPKPKIAGRPGQRGDGEPDEGEGGEGEEEEQRNDKLYGVLAYGMPWVISAFLHIGIFLLAMFIVFVVAAVQPKPVGIEIPDALLNTDNPGGVMNPGSGGDPNMRAAAPVKSNSKGFSKREGKVASDASGETGNIDLIGLGGGGAAGGGALAEFGLVGGGSGSGPKSGFYGSGGNAYQVVYVIDRSGSMIQTFDYLRKEMLTSIGTLKDVQDFHVIFYAMGTPVENPPKQLIAANRNNKVAAAEFLKGVTPEGQTDPVPAMQRAFQVLQGAKKTGKLIYLLSDGLFPDNALVLKTIKEQNPPGPNQAMINTYLYGERPKEAEEVMQKIATENKGRYKFVNPDE
ncbi:MAG: VWA domain-containing protein [Planctomycetes bacterium]|nr:VWA domain-containing protein [Planctomycetota bacterium]